MIDWEKLHEASKSFKQSPFDHCIVDGFFTDAIATALEAECPTGDSDVWHVYDNQIEQKKITNLWHRFGPTTYQAFHFLNSPGFRRQLSEMLGIPMLVDDPGLNGGGWHLHGPGGLLNPHLDYSLHPCLGLQRKINLIIYLNSEWDEEWGGKLGLWASDSDADAGNLAKEVAPLFNRAVIFDTTQNSWHGLASPVTCPEGQARRSLAVYYLVPPLKGVNQRGKALFAPTPEQASDPKILDLIKRRADVDTSHETYRDKKKE